MFDDPDLKTPSKSKRIFLRLVLFVLALALLGGTGFVLTMKIKFADFAPPMAPANVVIVKTAPLTFEDKIDAVGTALANEATTLTSTVSETVKSINVTEGQPVTAGTLLVELTDDEEQATLDEATRSYMRYNKLTQGNLGSVAERDSALAAMNVAKAQLNDRKIVAPFDGIVGIREVSLGDLVTPGTVITTIDAIDPIKLDFSVPETFLPAISTGMKVTAISEAYPDRTFQGTIYAIDSHIDTNTRAIRVRALVDNPDMAIKPGLLMKVTIIRNASSFLAVPEEAIMSAGERKFVFVVTADNKIEERTVTTGLREPGYVAIKDGLKEGDQVVLEGQMKTGAGAPVVVVGTKTIEDVNKDSLDYTIPRKREALEAAKAAAPSTPATTPAPEVPSASAPISEAAPVTPSDTPAASAPAPQPAPDAVPAPDATLAPDSAPEKAE